MSKNKHINKKTPCFSHKRSKNIAKANEFERRISKLSFMHAQTIQNIDVHLRVARTNFD